MNTLIEDLLIGHLNRDSEQSLQTQIYTTIQAAIHSGVLKPGARVPSSRMLAQAIEVSRVTIVNAYEKLLIDGYLQTGSGSGTYIADTLPTKRDQASQKLATQHTLSKRAEQLLQAPGGIQKRSGAFVPGVCDADQFPFQTWKRIQNRYAGEQHYGLTGYTNHGGYLPLRRALAEYLQISRSVRCTVDQIIVTLGTNQSIDLCSRVLCDHGDVAYVENPCHWATPIVLRVNGLKVVPIDIDNEGIQVKKFSHPAKLIVTTPSNQFPMGVVMSDKRRDELLDYADITKAYVIEDDYDGEFRYNRKPLPSLQGSAQTDRVIFLGTFSKIMYPGLRLSYLVVPLDLAEAFAAASQRLYRPGYLPLQASMADFIADGHFASHIRNMRAIYASRQAELSQCLDSHFGNRITMSEPLAGLHLTIRISGLNDIDHVVENAHNEGVYLRKLSLFNQSNKPFVDGFVLGFGAVPLEDIAPATATLVRSVSPHIK